MIFRNIFSTFAIAEICAKYIFYHTMMALENVFIYFITDVEDKSSSRAKSYNIINTQMVVVALGPWTSHLDNQVEP